MGLARRVGAGRWGLLAIALPCGGEAVAGLAVAAVAARSVDALRVALAHRAVLTLVDIYKQERTELQGGRNLVSSWWRLSHNMDLYFPVLIGSTEQTTEDGNFVF